MANNDVNVSMGLDDSDFNKGLNDATQSLKKFSDQVKLTTDNFNKSFATNTVGVTNFNNALTKLGTTIIAVFGAKSIAEMAEWANNIVQTGKAVGMTTGELVGLQSAVMQAGGTALAASRGIEMFYMKLDQARQGGYVQQEAFARIGITLDDLAKFDDKELFNKTIQNLGKMAPSAERNRLEVELLSKSFRGIPLQEIARNIDETKGKFDEFAPALEDAGKAYNQLQQDINAFKIATLDLLDPLMKAFAEIKPTVEDFSNVLQILASVIAGVIAYRFATYIATMTAGFTTLVPVINSATAALTAFATAEGAATGGLSIILSALARLAVGAGAYLITQELITDSLEKQKAAQMGLAGSIVKNSGNWDDAAAAGGKVYDATAKINAGIIQQTQAFANNIQTQIAAIKQQEEYIGKGEIEKAKIQERIRVYDEYARKIEETQVKLKEAQAAGPSDERSKTTGSLQKQLETLRQLQKIDSEDAAAEAERSAKKTASAQMQLQFLEDTIKLQHDYQNIVYDIETATATADERKLTALNKEEDQLIKVAMAKRRAQLGNDVTDEQLLNDAEIQKYIHNIDNAYGKIRTATKEQIATSREWKTGWESAFKQYVEDATNAANASKTIFDTATKGMEDAFVNFAKTGKLSFKDMTASILEEILRIQIRMAAANLMGGAGGASGGLSSMFSGVKSLLGFASGGVVPGNAPIIVGENGPEIFNPAGGGTITPNNQLASGTNVTYNINAVDAGSFKSMLARDPQFLYALTLQGRKSIPGA